MDGLLSSLVPFLFQSEATTAIILLFTGYLSARVITPVVIRLAPKGGFVATKDLRRRHDNETPLLGGIAIFLALILASILVYFFRGQAPANVNTPSGSLIWFTMPLALVFLLGAWDDWRRLNARPKLLIQSLAVTLFLLGNHALIDDLGLPHAVIPLVYGGLMILMVGIMNSVNLIDGMDGLASGTGAITSLFFCVGAILTGHHGYIFLWLAPTIAGACLGFLRFNLITLRPARIFLGDSGSLTIGFFLAAAAAEFILFRQSWAGVLMALMIIGYPLLDTATVMYLRARGKRPVFSGDRNHLHHRLYRVGLGKRRTIMMLWLLSVYLGLQSLFLIGAPGLRIGAILLALGILVFVSLSGLAFLERMLSLHVSRFGQANLKDLAPKAMGPYQFFSLIKRRIGATADSLQFHLVVVDYSKMMPQLFHASPETVDEFFRKSFEIVRTNLRPDTLVAKLSDSITVVFLPNAPKQIEANEAVASRITRKLEELQKEFKIASSDAVKMEGVTVISYPKGFSDLCQKIGVKPRRIMKIFGTEGQTPDEEGVSAKYILN